MKKAKYMNRIKQTIVTGGVILATFGTVTGCAAEEVPVPEGYEDIDTDLADVEEEVAPAEDMHMAEAVPYTGDEKEEADAEAPEEEPAEVEPEVEPGAGVQVWFEEGFGLTLPADWVGYPVSDDAAEKGIRYVVGDPSG